MQCYIRSCTQGPWHDLGVLNKAASQWSKAKDVTDATTTTDEAIITAHQFLHKFYSGYIAGCSFEEEVGRRGYIGAGGR